MDFNGKTEALVISIITPPIPGIVFQCPPFFCLRVSTSVCNLTSNHGVSVTHTYSVMGHMIFIQSHGTYYLQSTDSHSKPVTATNYTHTHIDKYSIVNIHLTAHDTVISGPPYVNKNKMGKQPMDKL